MFNKSQKQDQVKEATLQNDMYKIISSIKSLDICKIIPNIVHGFTHQIAMGMIYTNSR